MKPDRAKLSKVLEDYLEYGGVTGAEIPRKVDCIPAKHGSVLGVAFDPTLYKCEKHQDPSEDVDAYTLKAKKGGEAYIEVKNGKLYALISTGPNVEIWQNLLVIGARTDREIKAAKKTSNRPAKK